MEHPNAALARRFIEALDSQDVATIEALVAEDVIGHFPGDHAFSGTHEGRDSLFAAFAKADTLGDGPVERDVHDITASDDHIVILVRLRVRRAGERIAWNGANLWHVRDGVLREVWFLSEDQATTDRGFAAR